MKHTTAAFGGTYNHKVIKELRAKLAQSNLILTALVQHSEISEEELKAIVSDFMAKQYAQLTKRGV